MLFVEDSQDDVELIRFALARHGFSVQARVAETRAQLQAALDEGTWDVVLSDHSMQGFSSTDALRLLRDKDEDIPFIIVSGTIGEDAAVDAMRAGAHDYVLKHNLRRLGPAVSRELREAANRRLQRSTQAALLSSEQRLRHAQPLEAVGRLAGGRVTLLIDGTRLDAGQAADLQILPGDYVSVTVTDTGIGIDAAALEPIVEPCFTTKAAGSGTRLDLATLFGIVRQSGGAIEVDSAPQQGTTFRIYLPSSQNVESAPETGRAPAPPVVRSSTIMLAEDEQDVRTFLEMALTRAGHRVISATSGEHALALAARHDGPIDLLITDVVMPGLSGPDMADRVRQSHPSMRALFLSGYSSHAALPERVIADPVTFLQKPFTVDVLLAKVRERLSSV